MAMTTALSPASTRSMRIMLPTARKNFQEN